MRIIEARRNYEANTYALLFDSGNVYIDQAENESGEFIDKWEIRDLETHELLAVIDLQPN